MWWLAWLLFLPGPDAAEAKPWLGRYVAGPETIAFRWTDDGLVYDHGNIAIPVDGEWHLSVPEFHVRHRATWLPESSAIRLEESHDESRPWRHELRLSDGSIEKVSLDGGADGGDVVVRVFEREGAP